MTNKKSKSKLELKSCPFCGGSLISFSCENGLLKFVCNTCLVSGPWRSTHALCASHWNRRYGSNEKMDSIEISGKASRQ